MREVLIGQADYTVLVKIVGTDGAPETGLTEASIDLAYSRVETDNDVTISDVTPAALSALTDAHTDWGFEEVDATNAPGLYRLDIADAVFASGAWEAVVTITDASGTDFYPVDIGFRLVAVNALDGVRYGLTALPNAAADGVGGLPISDAGGLDLDARIGTDIPAILAQLPSSPVKNAAFTYVIKMVDGTDNVTPETGLTVTMTRSIDAAAFGAATGTVTEISTGHYKVEASAADMNGDVVAHRFTASGAADLTIVLKTVS